MPHIPVLLNETIEAMSLKNGDVVIDATVGQGGHAAKICELIGQEGELIACDRDPKSLEFAKKILAGSPCKKTYLESNYAELESHGYKADAILFDLGFGSHQMDMAGRGFSFLRDEPLVMTYDDTEIPAYKLLAEIDEKALQTLLTDFGEERFSRQIAREIVNRRVTRPILTTSDLVSAVSRAVPEWYKKRKIHYATKTFQALRIAINHELESLKKGLEKGWNILHGNGRMAVISYHSLEDRIVKQFFKSLEKRGDTISISKKVIRPSREEVMANRRSRSARLRIAVKHE